MPEQAADERPGPPDSHADFGAHVETHYSRLVAELFVITLDAAEAHELVRDAYARAWREWGTVVSSPDPAGWVRRVAVRSSRRRWRALAARLPGAVTGPVLPPETITDPRTRPVLEALARLPVTARRVVVLHHMAGLPLSEVAALERTSVGAVQARLARGRVAVVEGLAGALGALDVPGSDPYGAAAGEEQQ